MTPGDLLLCALRSLPEVRPGDDLAALLLAALESEGRTLRDGDVLVLAQKIVSKAEGRLVALRGVLPTAQARELAERTGKDARLVQCVLDESSEVVRAVPGVLIVRHKSGIVHANAGVDESNVAAGDAGPCALLLPVDADASASALHQALRERSGCKVAVIISDSGGRAWRLGVVGFAIGCAGFEALEDWVGEPDRHGRPLRHTQVAVADQLAAAASFVMGEAAQGVPAVLVRGAKLRPGGRGAKALIRPIEQDLFR